MTLKTMLKIHTNQLHFTAILNSNNISQYYCLLDPIKSGLVSRRELLKLLLYNSLSHSMSLI